MFSFLKKWAGFVRFSHTVFALPFALAAMLVAARDNHGWPGWRVFLLILAAMVCARTCAMAFNRIADRKFDALNPRTASRHLPTGQISLAGAGLLCTLSATGLMAASWLLNPTCFALSPVAIVVVCFYSLTKRFTDFTHVFLGVALALAPIGAWLAVTGSFDFWPAPCAQDHSPLRHSFLLPLLLAAAVVLWLIGFDIIYALQDYEFDRAHGLHSLVVRWGPKNALAAAFLAHLFMWGVLAAFGLLAGFRIAYAGGLILILACLVVEHWVARRRSLDWVNTAFFRLNALISFVFLAVTAGEVIFRGFRFTW
ncbi:MAG: putative 4-hydroxybenzoate polyprenyltransferase [Verrucomicrobia bacterium]|jgi:4-hydroxybenzoate polyprenyltransferase|nr:putative 4-hydroxybenzoate polyprenyltransferase [Verrucomicrobiota bacterium]